jgi:hypothetical protein
MWNDVHGGLTPPAPGWRCECLPAKSDFCDGPTHVAKSGGREPAVVRNESRLQGTANNVRPIMPVQSAAETVSPPWIANAGAIADVFLGRLTPTAPDVRGSSAEQGAIGSAPTHVPKSGGREPTVGCGIRAVSIRFCSAPGRLKIENGGPCSTSARQCSQRLRVGFARTDCRLGASNRLSAHLKENTGRIGTDRLHGCWPHLRSPSADYGSDWRGRIPGAQTLYARSSWSSRSQVEFPRAAKKAKCSGGNAGRFVFVTRDQRYQARRRSQR